MCLPGTTHGGAALCSCPPLTLPLIKPLLRLCRAPSKGGKTVFPAAAKTESALRGHPHAVDHKWYCENEGVLGAAPDAGDAVLFW